MISFVTPVLASPGDNREETIMCGFSFTVKKEPLNDTPEFLLRNYTLSTNNRDMLTELSHRVFYSIDSRLYVLVGRPQRNAT